MRVVTVPVGWNLISQEASCCWRKARISQCIMDNTVSTRRLGSCSEGITIVGGDVAFNFLSIHYCFPDEFVRGLLLKGAVCGVSIHRNFDLGERRLLGWFNDPSKIRIRIVPSTFSIQCVLDEDAGFTARFGFRGGFHVILVGG